MKYFKKLIAKRKLKSLPSNNPDVLSVYSEIHAKYRDIENTKIAIAKCPGILINELEKLIPNEIINSELREEIILKKVSVSKNVIEFYQNLWLHHISNRVLQKLILKCPTLQIIKLENLIPNEKINSKIIKTFAIKFAQYIIEVTPTSGQEQYTIHHNAEGYYEEHIQPFAYYNKYTGISSDYVSEVFVETKPAWEEVALRPCYTAADYENAYEVLKAIDKQYHDEIILAIGDINKTFAIKLQNVFNEKSLNS